MRESVGVKSGVYSLTGMFPMDLPSSASLAEVAAYHSSRLLTGEGKGLVSALKWGTVCRGEESTASHVVSVPGNPQIGRVSILRLIRAK